MLSSLFFLGNLLDKVHIFSPSVRAAPHHGALSEISAFIESNKTELFCSGNYYQAVASPSLWTSWDLSQENIIFYVLPQPLRYMRQQPHLLHLTYVVL